MENGKYPRDLKIQQIYLNVESMRSKWMLVKVNKREKEFIIIYCES